jgi:hypothetical protein
MGSSTRQRGRGDRNGGRLAYPPASFDLALCTLALHHFDPAAAVTLLRNMARDARHVLVYDVERSRPAHLGVLLLTRALRMHFMTRHDAAASVRRACSCSLASHGAAHSQPRHQPPSRACTCSSESITACAKTSFMTAALVSSGFLVISSGTVSKRDWVTITMASASPKSMPCSAAPLISAFLSSYAQNLYSSSKDFGDRSSFAGTALPPLDSGCARIHLG